ncbi:MAG: hypothetical protein ABIP64_05140 [Burkholderiales bacterium]
MTSKNTRRFTFASLIAVSLLGAGLTLAADDPLDPSYQTPQQKAYWKDKLAKMDTKGEGVVTKEGYLKHYADLWEHYFPGGKAVSINDVDAKWSSLETENPLDPEFKTGLWWRGHVAKMDSNNDGMITKEEMLKHMETVHWDVATKISKSSTLRLEEANEMMRDNPLHPSHKFD